MYAFIKTPLYKNSKHIPHIVEHCVLSNDKIYSEYLQDNYDSRGVTFCGYTKFYFSTKNIKKVISNLNKPISEEKIKIEMKIINDELKNENDTQELFGKI